jgi:hypothetical protein
MKTRSETRHVVDWRDNGGSRDRFVTKSCVTNDRQIFYKAIPLLCVKETKAQSSWLNLTHIPPLQCRVMCDMGVYSG